MALFEPSLLCRSSCLALQSPALFLGVTDSSRNGTNGVNQFINKVMTGGKFRWLSRESKRSQWRWYRDVDLPDSDLWIGNLNLARKDTGHGHVSGAHKRNDGSARIRVSLKADQLS